MRFRTALLGAAAAFAFAPAAHAERGTDGEVKLTFPQAVSIMNPYLSSGTKDVIAASMVIEPLAAIDGPVAGWLSPTALNAKDASMTATITPTTTPPPISAPRLPCRKGGRVTDLRKPGSGGSLTPPLPAFLNAAFAALTPLAFGGLASHATTSSIERKRSAGSGATMRASSSGRLNGLAT